MSRAIERSISFVTGMSSNGYRVSKNGKLLIDKNGNVRSNYNNPDVRKKLEDQMSAQDKIMGRATSYLKK